jgi:hypothetical protein
MDNLQLLYSVDKKTMDEWIAEGGTLLGTSEIGCGINVLTFLDIIPRQIAERIVGQLLAELRAKNGNVTGTSFLDMMNAYNQAINEQFRRQGSPKMVELGEVIVDIRDEISGNISPVKLRFFFEFLLKKFTDNARIMVKLNRAPPHTLGHSVILEKTDGEIYTIDPQLQRRALSYSLKLSPSDREERFSKVLKNFSDNMFMSISFAYVKKDELNQSLQVAKNDIPIPPSPQPHTQGPSSLEQLREAISSFGTESKAEQPLPNRIAEFLEKNKSLFSQEFINHLIDIDNSIEKDIAALLYSQNDNLNNLSAVKTHYDPVIEGLFSMEMFVNNNLVINRSYVVQYKKILTESISNITQIDQMFDTQTSSNQRYISRIQENEINLITYLGKINEAVDEFKSIYDASRQDIMDKINNLFELTNSKINRIAETKYYYDSQKRQIEVELERLNSSMTKLENVERIGLLI